MLLASLLLAAQTFVPPVPKGIAGEGKIHKPLQPIVFPAEDEKWLRVRSPHFEFISSAGERRTREIAEGLETLAAALTKLHPRFAAAPVPAKVFLFTRRKESQPYFDLLMQRRNAPASGLFVRKQDGGTMIIDEGRSWLRDRTPFHELVHDLLAQSTDAHPPIWIEEGLAEYYSNADVRGSGGMRAGGAIREHIALLKQRPHVPLDQFFAMRSDDAGAMSTIFYAQSWAAVDWLMRTNRDAFYDFLHDVERGVAVPTALRTRYKRDVRDLAAGIDNASSSNSVWIPVEHEAPELSVSPIDRATILYELGAFLTGIEGAEEEGARHFAEALKIDPRHARTLAAVGRFEEAVRSDPKDAHVLLAYSESLMKEALGPFTGIFTAVPADLPKFRKARELAERALANGADEAKARGAIGVSYVVEQDLAPGIAQLERAHQLAPSRTDLALQLYAMYLHTDRAKADALYATDFAEAREPQTRFNAKNILLRVETDRANALVREGKLDEAAALVQSLAAGTPDATTRKDLEAQAANLARLAGVNREIAMYNKAVEQTNDGAVAAAVATLDALLATATDEAVIRDAKKLRGDLIKSRKR